MQEHVMESDPVVVDVTDGDFAETVVEESNRRPVVIDLWASWCGPCKTLGPILEKVAAEHSGDFLLAKLDVDANPYTAARFGVQSIPTVIAFRGGQPVDGFIGALPEDAVRQWIDKLLPSEADRAADEALQEERSGDTGDAEDRYRHVLASDPDNRAARLGLGRILAERGELEEARETIASLLPDPEAEAIMAMIRVAGWSSLTEAGTLASAKRLAAAGHWQKALDGMLGALRDDPDAREAMLDVFAVLGDEDPLAQEYRRKLANALF
jgi:putative thioredoxin